MIKNKNKENIKINEINITKSNLSNLNDFFINKKIGLTNIEADNYLKEYGYNTMDIDKNNIFKDIIKEIFSPFNFLLFVIVIFNFIEYFININSSDSSTYLVSGIIIIIMIVLSTSVSLIVENKTNDINKELQKLIKSNVNVIRNFDFNINEITKETYSKMIKFISTINSKDLAIGDVIHLSAGDVVPANVRIIYEHHLLVDESSITGESDNIHKTSLNIINFKETELTYKNICYTGSTIISGFGLGVVFQQVKHSFLNDLVKKNNTTTREKNTFKVIIKSITKVILIMVLFTVILIFLILSLKNLLSNSSNHDVDLWISSLVFSIAVAVSLIPESLPVIISANLSMGSKNMANKKMLIKSINSVQEIGLINILCTDKTGTLTNNEINLDKHFGFYDNEKYFLKDSKRIFELAYYNSYYQTGLVNNAIDNAILKHNKWIQNNDSFIKVDEIPFNFKRRILSVIINFKDNENNLLISKGAVEEILKVSKKYEINGKVLDLKKDVIDKLKKETEKLNNKGFRVVAIGYKKIDKNKKELFNSSDENGLILSGFLTFSDTPKEGIVEAIKIINEYGVELKIISGDNEIVTRSICSKINFKITNLITGNILNKIDKKDLYKKITDANAFVKISPLQKSKIIEILQKNNKVGFLGDGINDSIALKKSDVAISVDNASEIAKKASDIILLEKNLKVIEDGLIQGRITFANIVKFIKITLVSKFSLMLTFIIFSSWLKFQLLTPFQIILLDLILDFVQLAFIFDRINPNLIKTMKDYKLKNWYIFAVFNGPVITFIALINYIVMKYIFINSNIEQFHTSVFTEIALISIFSIFVLRSKTPLFHKSDIVPSKVILIILIIVFVILLLPYIPYLNNWLELSKLKFTWYLMLISYAIFYWILQEFFKFIYIKIFKTWI